MAFIHLLRQFVTSLHVPRRRMASGLPSSNRVQTEGERSPTGSSCGETSLEYGVFGGKNVNIGQERSATLIEM